MPYESALAQTLDARLQAARRRWRSIHVWRTAWWALAVGAASTAMLAVARLWHPWSDAALDVGFAVAVGLAAMGATVLGRVAHLFVATPSSAALARRADARFGLAERASTALDVRRGGARSTVARLLLADAERHAQRIDPVALLPGPGAGPVVRALGIATIAVVAWAVPTPSPAPTLPVPGAPGPPAVDFERTEENARRIAELLEEEASGDDYLEAVGRAFEDLADRIERGEVDAATVERELEGLLGQFAEALGDQGPDDDLAEALSTFRPPPVPGQETEEQRTRDISNLPPPQPGIDVLGDQQAPENEAARRATNRDAPSAPGAAEALDDLREALEQRQQDRETERANLGVPTNVDPDRSFAYFEGDPETLAALEERRRLLAETAGAQGQTAVGGAEESSDAPGDLAGEGTAALDEGAASPEIDPSQVAVQSVELPDQVREEGATVDVQAAPETEYVDIEDVDPEMDRPWWRGAQTADPSRSPALAHREAVARYFLPDSATDEDAR